MKLECTHTECHYGARKPVKPNQPPTPEPPSGPGWYHDEPGYILAMMGLQSERYREDPDYRDAVDNVLNKYLHHQGQGPEKPE